MGHACRRYDMWLSLGGFHEASGTGRMCVPPSCMSLPSSHLKRYSSGRLL